MSFNSQKENVLFKTYIGFILVGWNFRSLRTLAEKIWEDAGFLSGFTVFPPNVILMVKISDPKFSLYSINICDYVSPQNSRLASASTAEASSKTKLQALNRFTAYKNKHSHVQKLFSSLRLKQYDCYWAASTRLFPVPQSCQVPPSTHNLHHHMMLTWKERELKMATEMFFKADVQRKSAHITDSSGQDFGVNMKRRYKKAQKPESYCNFGDATHAYSCGTTAQRRYISINNKVDFMQQCTKTRIHSKLIFSIFWKTSWTVGL